MNRFSLYLSGWVVITLAYVSTLYFVGNLYSWLSGLPLDHQRSLSGLVIGSAMATIPYMIGGLFIKTSGKDRAEIPAIWTSVVPAIGEKILIFLIGAFFVASGGDGSGDGECFRDFVPTGQPLVLRSAEHRRVYARSGCGWRWLAAFAVRGRWEKNDGNLPVAASFSHPILELLFIL